MALTIIVRVTTIGQNAGPTFNLYSDADGYTNTFATATTNQLIAGFQVTAPPNTTMVKIVSTGTCGTIIYTTISGIPPVSPSVSPTPTVTPSVTPTITPTPSSSTPPSFPPTTDPPYDPCSGTGPESRSAGPGEVYCQLTVNGSCIPMSVVSCACAGYYDCIPDGTGVDTGPGGTGGQTGGGIYIGNGGSGVGPPPREG